MTSLGAPAQTQDERPSKKDAGTATLFSLLVIGGGQIYAGDLTRGLLMLGGATGAVITGAVLSSSGGCDYNGTLVCQDDNYAPLYAGAVAALGIGIWSVIDASPTTKRMNAKNGYPLSTVTPVLRGGQDGTRQLGLKIAF